MLDGDNTFDCNYRCIADAPIVLGDLCPICESKGRKSQMRPDVIWFNEPVDMHDSLFYALTSLCDIFIGCGTSAQVYPAAGLLSQFCRVKEKYFIDPNPPLRLQSYTRITGTASEHLPKLADELLKRA